MTLLSAEQAAAYLGCCVKTLGRATIDASTRAKLAKLWRKAGRIISDNKGEA